MAKLSKEYVIKIVIECARMYEKNLMDRTLLFVLMDKHKTYLLRKCLFAGIIFSI